MASGRPSGAMTRERLAVPGQNRLAHKDQQFKEPKLSENLELVERLRVVGARQAVHRVKPPLPGRYRFGGDRCDCRRAQFKAGGRAWSAAIDFRLTPSEIAEVEGQ